MLLKIFITKEHAAFFQEVLTSNNTHKHTHSQMKKTENYILN